MYRIRTAVIVILSALLLPALATASSAPLVAQVSISSQTMTVYSDGEPLYTWPVSTARRGKITPTGSWSAKWLSRHHRSSLYNNAPMPFSIFFNGNYAIHGTDQVSKLGRPASAGCVRLHPEHAEILFYMTQSVGKENMHVVINQ